MDERANQISAAADSDEYDENTEQLRAGIEDTRADMSQTLNEIQERLSPEHLVDQAKEAVREATIGKVEKAMGAVAEPVREVAGRAGNAIKEVGTTVGDTIWKNPIPLALIGLGVGMLVMKNYRGQSYESSSSPRRLPQNKRSNYAMGDVGQPQQNTGAGTLNQVKETASDLANRSTQTLNELGTKAKNSASRLGEIMRDNPLAAGAVAIAAGTAVGLMIP